MLDTDVISTWAATALPPPDWLAATVLWAPASSMLYPTSTAAPAAANWTAISCPMPVLAPVTRATLPERSDIRRAREEDWGVGLSGKKFLLPTRWSGNRRRPGHAKVAASPPPG